MLIYRNDNRLVRNQVLLQKTNSWMNLYSRRRRSPKKVQCYFAWEKNTKRDQKGKKYFFLWRGTNIESLLDYWFKEQQDVLESQKALFDISRHVSSHCVLEEPFDFFAQDSKHLFFVSTHVWTHVWWLPFAIELCLAVISPWRIAHPQIREQEFSEWTYAFRTLVNSLSNTLFFLQWLA